jgi:hypothetical protein
MSNLQALGRRCPIMGKALAVQTAKTGKMGLGGVASIQAIRAFSGKVNSGKAKLHTSRPVEARAMEGILVNDQGWWWYDSSRGSSLILPKCPALPPSPLPLRLRPMSSMTTELPSLTTNLSTMPNLRRSTRINPTDTSTTSTVLPRNSPALTRTPTRKRSLCGVPMITSAWAATSKFSTLCTRLLRCTVQVPVDQKHFWP